MDRPCFRLLSSSALLSLGVLATVTTSSGCRSTRSEVPPGKPYARTGEQTPSVGFSAQPHPAAGGMNQPANIGPGGMVDDRLAAGSAAGGQTAPMFGTPTANDKGVDLPTANAFGPLGTSGADPSGGAGAGDVARALMDTGQSVSKSLADDPGVKAMKSMAPNQ